MPPDFASSVRELFPPHRVLASANEALQCSAAYCPVCLNYIDGFYNVERLHSHLDYVSPLAFELKATVAAIAA